MNKGATYRLCEGICITIITIVMCIHFFVPKYYIEPDFGTIIIVDLIWVISFILPAVFSYLDSTHAYSDGATGIAIAGAFLTSFLMMWWFFDVKPLESDLGFGICFFVIGPILAAIINFIPLGIISWMLIISNPSVFLDNISTDKGNDDSGTKTYQQTNKTATIPVLDSNHTGYMNRSSSGFNSVLNNTNDTKLEYYKNNDTDFTLVHEKLFGCNKLEFRKNRNKGFLDHDYDVIADNGKRYYADINPLKGIPEQPDLFLYKDGEKIDLYYKDLPQFYI